VASTARPSVWGGPVAATTVRPRRFRFRFRSRGILGVLRGLRARLGSESLFPSGLVCGAHDAADKPERHLSPAGAPS
jgi:hypothetical protein